MDKRKRGRPRKSSKAWMPPCVSCDKTGYYYDNRTEKKWIRFHNCPPSAAQSEVWAAYEALGNVAQFTIDDLLNKYFLSPQFIALRPRTQTDYEAWAVKLRAVFGRMQPDNVTSEQVTLFMDARGASHPVAANHERSLLNLVFNWGKGRGYTKIANPCTGVPTIKTGSRNIDRNYDDKDHYAFYNFLGENGFPVFQTALELAYLCGARQQDILRLYDTRPIKPCKDDCYITKEGIHIWQAKTGKVQLKLFTARLKAAVQVARDYKAKSPKTAASPWLICNRTGAKYTRSGFNSIWGKQKRLAVERGVISKSFRFHDTKHKAITDFEGNKADKQEFSGHSQASMINHYDHSESVVRTIDKPLKPKDNF